MNNFLYSIPDLTIVGFLRPDDGLGKIPINILDTLEENVVSNFIFTDLQKILPSLNERELSIHVNAALNNQDKQPGMVALLTETLGSELGMRPAQKVPNESMIKLSYSMLETTSIPKFWVTTLNQTFDAVIVPDDYLVSIYRDSGVKIPIFVLPIPMKLKDFYSQPIHQKKPNNPFIFADFSANKNPLILIEAFAKAFGNNKKALLKMRAGYVSEDNLKLISDKIKKLKLQNVSIEDGHLSLSEYINRLSSCDCFVNLSRGEGFSFIPREALALGIPVIISNNSASKTICNSNTVTAVPSEIRVPANPLYKSVFIDDCGEQFDCKIEDVVTALRDVYSNYPLHIKKAQQGRNWVKQYDCKNSTLKSNFLALIKPTDIEFGKNNYIKGGKITTNCPKLYEKYKLLLEYQTLKK